MHVRGHGAGERKAGAFPLSGWFCTYTRFHQRWHAVAGPATSIRNG